MVPALELSRDPAHKFKLLRQELLELKFDFSNLNPDIISALAIKIKDFTSLTYDHIAALQPTMATTTLNFSQVVQPLITLSTITSKASSLCTFPMHVHPEQSLRDAAEAAKNLLDRTKIENEQREDVYTVIRQYASDWLPQEQDQLHHEELRFFEHLLRDYKRNGLHLTDPAIKQQITDLKKQLADLTNTFEKNLGEENTCFEFSREELTGMPETWFTESRLLANGKYKFTLKYPDAVPAMEYLENRSLREKIYLAFQNRCVAENTPLLQQIIILRAQLAELLGYDTAADYATGITMAKSASTVLAFLHDMDLRFNELLDQDLIELTKIAQEHSQDPSFQLQLWDMGYYMRLRKEKVFSINLKEMEKYFPLEKVITGTLAIYQRLLHLDFVAADTANAWHPEVKAFDVFDRQTENEGKYLGKFYLDLHPRPGKYGHAAAFELIFGCSTTDITGIEESRLAAQVAMVCNLPREGGVPFRNMVTFFHEFGHLMHLICSETKLQAMNGFCVELDFIEAPSQMLENWCYEPEALAILSEHPETKEPLPATIAAKLNMMRNIHQGYEQKRQLSFNKFDYSVHNASSHALAAKFKKPEDLNKCFSKLMHTTIKLPLTNMATPANFGHIVGEYTAKYYSYLWSKVMAADMYTKFKGKPLDPAVGLHYRKSILTPGATKDASDLVHNFLGRPPTLDAFLVQSGLISTPAAAPCDDEPAPQAKRQKAGPSSMF